MGKLWSKSGSVIATDCLSTFRQYLLSKGAVWYNWSVGTLPCAAAGQSASGR